MILHDFFNFWTKIKGFYVMPRKSRVHWSYGAMSGLQGSYIDLGRAFFSFVSRLLASRIHEVRDLEKNPLVLSVSADYTKIPKN